MGGGLELSAESPARFENAARTLRIPVLLVRGGSSDILSEEGVRAFLEVLPSAETVDVAGAAHMVAGDQNDPFNAAVIEFLTRVLGHRSGARGDGAALPGART
jgi:non-heme chloroperoxidase